jgi:polyisoprenoid-binding protein YceI
MLRGILALSVCAGSLFAQPAEWRIDSAHSAAQFTVRHMMVSNVRGHFGKLAGTARFDAADPAKGSLEVTVDVASIDTREPKRDAHLKSADFFDAEKHPAMTFKSKRIDRAGSGYRLTGDLTIRGVTREVVFNVEGLAPEVKDGRGGVRTGATATARINRKDFGLTWNRAIETGGVVVGDEVAITVDLQFIRKL